MQVEELKQKIASMSVSELAEVETFIQELMSDRATTTMKGASFEDAAKHVRTDYPHLLHQLSH